MWGLSELSLVGRDDTVVSSRRGLVEGLAAAIGRKRRNNSSIEATSYMILCREIKEDNCCKYVINLGQNGFL